MILVEVDAVLGHAVEPDARAAYLGQAVGFMRLDPHALLDFLAHGRGPGSAPNTPTRRGSARMSTFISAARSAMVRA